jgi:hypothetical protein
LLILGVLRVLGRHFCFDDVAEATGISEETCRLFFHAFCARWSQTKYPELVKSPSTPAEFDAHRHEYHLAGFDDRIFGIIMNLYDRQLHAMTRK